MGKLVTPKVYMVGYTTTHMDGLIEYLVRSGNQEFAQHIQAAEMEGISKGEIICSMFAKLCYKSLTLGKNDNISRVRDIEDNIKGCFDSGHGSVFEHCSINFIATDVSRVFTHELVRHRAGSAFSQTSGRYVRGTELDIVFDPILEPVREHVETVQHYLEDAYKRMVRLMDLDNMKDFARKKAITSALRRILPNGQANEIGFTLNLRALRHTVTLRTNRQAEWEIRAVFSDVYKLVKEKFPLVFYGAKEEMVDGALEITGMKMQPYEIAS